MSWGLARFDRRRYFLLVVLCVIVGTAGCLSVGYSDAQNTTPDGAEANGTDDVYSIEHSTESDGSVATSDPAGNDTVREAGSVDSLVISADNESAEATTDTASSTSLGKTHLSAIESAETATTSVRASLETEYGTVSFDTTIAVDLSANEAHQQTLFDGSTGGGLLTTTFADVESYATSEATYERTTSDFTDDVEYQYSPIESPSGVWDEESLTQYLQMDLVGNADENVIWTRDGTETFDGIETARFVADGETHFEGFHENATSTIDRQTDEAEDGQAFSLGDDDSVTISSMNATLLVGPAGIARQLTFQLDGAIEDEPVTLSIDLSVTGIDSTTVTEPEWTATAVSSAD